MAAIFLSHSSLDIIASDDVRRWLDQSGHRSVFLDFDPQYGIPAGRDWERELYVELRSCRAAIALCSEHWLSSSWCFAEATQVRALGKPLFLVKTSPCEVPSFLRNVQAIELYGDRTEALRRLELGLRAAGLDPKATFDRDPARPPYPGLLAFDEGDAAVFFGRDAEIAQARELIDRLHRFGGAHLAVMLGASGSGKSSLMRAGILPRLRRDTDRWIVVPAFRPHDQPFDGLAAVVALACRDCGVQCDLASVQSLLRRPDATQAFVALLRQMRLSSGRGQAKILLCIDQFEEQLSHPHQAAESFLSFLGPMLQEAKDLIFAFATLRSDYLREFQTHSVLRELQIEQLLVAPLALRDFGAVIEQPANGAGVDLEPGLVQALIQDAKTPDALPLLAFVLRELWERFGQDGRITLAEYREQLGGLEASIARTADAIMRSSRLDDAGLAMLRSSFLSMVRVNEGGVATRRPAAWDDMPAPIRPVVERFVDGRLLLSRDVQGRRMVEVAHEALFRSWAQLAAWLNENREFLVWRVRFGHLLEEWERNGSTLSGNALKEATNWLAEREPDLGTQERQFIAASTAASRREKGRGRWFSAIRGLLAFGGGGIALVLSALAARALPHPFLLLLVGAFPLAGVVAGLVMTRSLRHALWLGCGYLLLALPFVWLANPMHSPVSYAEAATRSGLLAISFAIAGAIGTVPWGARVVGWGAGIFAAGALLLAYFMIWPWASQGAIEFDLELAKFLAFLGTVAYYAAAPPQGLELIVGFGLVSAAIGAMYGALLGATRLERQGDSSAKFSSPLGGVDSPWVAAVVFALGAGTVCGLYFGNRPEARPMKEQHLQGLRDSIEELARSQWTFKGKYQSYAPSLPVLWAGLDSIEVGAHMRRILVLTGSENTIKILEGSEHGFAAAGWNEELLPGLSCAVWVGRVERKPSTRGGLIAQEPGAVVCDAMDGPHTPTTPPR